VEVISTAVKPVEGGHYTGQLADAKIELMGRVKVGGLREEARSGLCRLNGIGLHAGNLLPTLLHPDFDLGIKERVHCLLHATVTAFPISVGVAPVAFGLLLEPLQESPKTYQRLGTFKLTGDDYSWFDDCKTQEVDSV
jgi:hypothetical protein